jgi:hypothetical protein
MIPKLRDSYCPCHASYALVSKIYHIHGREGNVSWNIHVLRETNQVVVTLLKNGWVGLSLEPSLKFFELPFFPFFLSNIILVDGAELFLLEVFSLIVPSPFICGYKRRQRPCA